ncbi:MAG: hypothetical protein ACRCSF_06380 [Mycobacteriaceae bacterium]
MSFFTRLAIASSVSVATLVGSLGLVSVNSASAGPAEDCQAVRDRDHAIYLQLIASLPPGSPVPPEIINPCIEAPSTTPTTLAPTTFETPTPGQTSGGIGYGADVPHTGTLTITIQPGQPAGTVVEQPGQPARVSESQTSSGTNPFLVSQDKIDLIPDCLIGKNPDGSCRGHGAVNGSGEEVTIPDRYVYDPKCYKKPPGVDCLTGYRMMHDYCSLSPDQMPSLGANANFSGPCAVHDLCMSEGGQRFTCNNQFWDDLTQNCKYTYGLVDPRYALCTETAAAYYAGVTLLNPPIIPN